MWEAMPSSDEGEGGVGGGGGGGGGKDETTDNVADKEQKDLLFLAFAQIILKWN